MKRGKREIEFNMEWGDLATYNSEVARGLVHTEAWKLLMKAKQDRYNRMLIHEPNKEDK